MKVKDATSDWKMVWNPSTCIPEDEIFVLLKTKDNWLFWGLYGHMGKNRDLQGVNATRFFSMKGFPDNVFIPWEDVDYWIPMAINGENDNEHANKR